MKKVLLYAMVIFVIGGIFSLSIHKDTNNILPSGMGIIAPIPAYADSDTVGIKPPPPPPPPIN